MNIYLRPLYFAEQIAWLGVPAFFVLSGYLIGGILFRTRNREGFFRVFYGRRMLRVFPLYYMTLIAIAGVAFAHGVPLHYGFWSHFVYLQNFMPGYTSAYAPPNSETLHLWSLAIEEQFYLTWPLVVWFARDRRTLLKIIAILSAGCWIVRLASPWLHLSPVRCYYATPTRADAILLGVALALLAEHRLYKRVEPWAKYAAVAGMALWLLSFSLHSATPANYYRIAVEIPLANFTVLAVLVAVLEEGSRFANACSARWVCWLGSMSYGLYLFHFTYRSWFLDSFQPQLLRYLPEPAASILTAAIALSLTLALGMLSYRFIERPAMKLKNVLVYGPERIPQRTVRHTPVGSLVARRG